jgi:hypothetical protein
MKSPDNSGRKNSEKFLHSYLKQTKMSFFKNKGQEGKTGPV